MYHQDDKEAFDILGGQSVPKAKPETIEDMEIWQAALRVRRNRRHLPPLRLPELENNEPLLRFSPLPIAAIAFSVVAVLLVTLWMPRDWLVQPPPVGEISKDISSVVPLVLDDITLSHSEAHQLYLNVKKIVGADKITLNKIPEDNLWILSFQWQPVQVEALAQVFALYGQDNLVKKYTKGTTSGTVTLYITH